VRVVGEDAPAAGLVDPPLAAWQHGIQLAAADVAPAAGGSAVAVALTWQATENVHTDYTVFIQALDSQGRLVAQVDRQPQDGQAPTSTWQAGSVIEDQVELAVPPDEPVQIIAGLYDRSGVRLPLADGRADYFVAR
jgi:hypothetical protein